MDLLRELAIRNILLYKEGGLEEVALLTYDCTNYVSSKDYAPVPLSREILDLCVFNYSGDSCWFLELPEDNKGYRTLDLFSSSTSEFALPLTAHLATNDASIPIREISYLHQLQNLYYALTGKEMQVRLTLRVPRSIEARKWHLSMEKDER